MKKLVSLFTAAGLMITCFCSCGEKKNISDKQESSIIEVMVPLEMPDIDISIPGDYEETSTDSNNTVFLKNDASIIVNSDIYTEEYNNIDEYVDFAVATYETYSDEVEILRRDKRSDEYILLEFIYKLNTDNGVFSKYCMVGYFTDGKQLYLVTCKADTDTYKKYYDEFLEVIESVNLK